MTIERIKTNFVLKPEEEAIRIYGLGRFKTELSIERIIKNINK